MKISCIVDNRAGLKSNLYAEHGFSLLVEEKDTHFMVDTGQTPTVLKHNMDLMGIKAVDGVMMSHGHNDHTGGISAIKDSIGINSSKTKFYMHPEILGHKYAVMDDKQRYVGFPKNVDVETLNLEWVTENTRISDDMWIFNQVEDHSGFEPIPEYLKVMENGKCSPDEFKDELNLVIKTENGLVVISGCAHKGIVNILASVTEYFHDDIYGVIGGSHLMDAPPERIRKTVESFKKLNPEIIALGHCTGFNALCLFKREFGDKFTPLESGAEILI
jgi:7,8-dihydropterin-6-yl-methyl-4-(beta-D-ribofuranosyl)aminobenzene 5'-phosphate synthase